MDPMTMMAIANTAMQIFGGINSAQNKGGKDAPAAGGPGVPPGETGNPGPGGQQMPLKQFTPGPIPDINTTDYGSIIKNMIPGNMPPAPNFMVPQAQQQQRLF